LNLRRSDFWELPIGNWMIENRANNDGDDRNEMPRLAVDKNFDNMTR